MKNSETVICWLLKAVMLALCNIVRFVLFSPLRTADPDSHLLPRKIEKSTEGQCASDKVTKNNTMTTLIQPILMALCPQA